MQRFKQKPLAKFAWHAIREQSDQDPACKPVCHSVQFLASLALDVEDVDADVMPYHSTVKTWHAQQFI